MIEDAPQFDSLKNIGDIKSLITNSIPESDTLEYKAARISFTDNERKEIAKDISAMANASGGVIIYGVSTMERGKNKTLPDKVTYVYPGNAEVLDQVINSQIRPPIKGIRKKFIGRKKSHKVMVVYVPQSPESPHQSLIDKRYYRRSLTESLPMEHDLVALHFGKRLAPMLQLLGSYSGKEKPELVFGEDGFSQDLELFIMVLNTGKKIAKYVKAVIAFHESDDLRLVSAGELSSIGELYPGKAEKYYQYSQTDDVIHPYLKLRIATIKIKVTKKFLAKNHSERCVFNWKLFADNMERKDGQIYF